jgi:hypothetical protein
LIEKSSFFVVGKVVIDMLNVVKEKLELSPDLRKKENKLGK